MVDLQDILEIDERSLVYFRNNFSLSEHRLFLHLLKSAFFYQKGISRDNNDLMTLKASLDLHRLLGITQSCARNISKGFYERKNDLLVYWTVIDENSGQAVDYQCNPFSVLEYNRAEITYQLNPFIIGLLGQIQEKFNKVSYDITSLKNSKTKYALRLAEMLILHRGCGRHNNFDIELLRKILLSGCSGSHKRNIDFIKDCIKPAVKGIELSTNSKFGFKVEKCLAYKNDDQEKQQFEIRTLMFDSPKYKGLKPVYVRQTRMYYDRYHGQYIEHDS